MQFIKKKKQEKKREECRGICLTNMWPKVHISVRRKSHVLGAFKIFANFPFLLNIFFFCQFPYSHNGVVRELVLFNTIHYYYLCGFYLGTKKLCEIFTGPQSNGLQVGLPKDVRPCV